MSCKLVRLITVDGVGEMGHFNEEIVDQYLQLSYLLRFIFLSAASLMIAVSIYAIYIEIKGR